MADLADIVKRHEAHDADYKPLADYQARYRFIEAHADRAALIAMVKEAHAALKPLAKMMDGYRWSTDRVDMVAIPIEVLREAARILAVRE